MTAPTDLDPIYTQTPTGPVIYENDNPQQTYFLVLIPFVGDALCMHYENLEDMVVKFQYWLQQREQGQYRGIVWAFYGQRVTVSQVKPVYDVTIKGVGTFEVAPKRDVPAAQ